MTERSQLYLLFTFNNCVFKVGKVNFAHIAQETCSI